MGSKRSSSKNPSKVPSSSTPAPPPDDENHRNLKNHKTPNPSSPSKSRKKQKLSTPISPDNGSLSPIPPNKGDAPPQNSNHKVKVPVNSNEISSKDGDAIRSSSLHWGEDDILKFLKAVIAFRLKTGFLPTPSHMTDFLTEITDWTSNQLSERNLNSKIRHLRYKFQKSPKPGPESSEFDRSFHELGTQVWGPESLKVRGSTAGSVKEEVQKEKSMVEKEGSKKEKMEKTSKKENGEKQDVHRNNEDEDGVEEEERDSEEDEGSDVKTEKSMEVENGEEHEKDELLVGEESILLDKDVAGYPYKYLKIALEEYWTEAKMNMDTLYSALPKVDPVQAKRLDEQFLEVFEGMLKLKMEKNKVSNDIIRASLGR